MSRYVFDKPEAMFHWIDETAKKLLSIPREEFGKIEINISRTKLGVTYDWIIDPVVKRAYKEKFKNEKK